MGVAMDETGTITAARELEEAAPLERNEPVPETRALRWGMREPTVTRPYIDLAYW